MIWYDLFQSSTLKNMKQGKDSLSLDGCYISMLYANNLLCSSSNAFKACFDLFQILCYIHLVLKCRRVQGLYKYWAEHMPIKSSATYDKAEFGTT